jgi:mono/diheme cytochrome c family protein
MQRNVKNITDEQIAAVIEYISTLTGNEPTDEAASTSDTSSR